MDWFVGIGCGVAYLLGACVGHLQTRKSYKKRLAELQEELRQERADRLIKTENEKAKRSDIARKGWKTRRAA